MTNNKQPEGREEEQKSQAEKLAELRYILLEVPDDIVNIWQLDESIFNDISLRERAAFIAGYEARGFPSPIIEGKGEVCGNCGAVYGLHQSITLHCPFGGYEGDGTRWGETTWINREFKLIQAKKEGENLYSENDMKNFATRCVLYYSASNHGKKTVDTHLKEYNKTK